MDIIEGRRTVEGARHFYGETAAAYVLGRDAPYAEGLQVTAPAGSTADQEESIIAGPMADQIAVKLKELVGA